MGHSLGSQLEELGRAGVLIVDEALGEGAVLNVGQNFLHVVLDVGADHTRAGDVVAVLGRVGARPALLRQAALVDEVHDELHLVAHLEVGHLRLVSRLDERFEAVLDELGDAAAQNGLLAEQIGLRLLAEGRLDDARAGGADGRGVGQGELEGLAGGVLLHAHEGGNAAPLLEKAAHGVARALGGDHADVVGRTGLDVAVVDVEAVGEEHRGVLLEIRLNVVGPDRPLRLVGRQDHDDVGLGDGVGDGCDLQALLLGLGDRLRTLAEPDNHLDARIAQVQRMGVALRSVADDGCLLGLDQRQVRIGIVEDFSHVYSP